MDFGLDASVLVSDLRLGIVERSADRVRVIRVIRVIRAIRVILDASVLVSDLYRHCGAQC